jgi:hypothetical protein
MITKTLTLVAAYIAYLLSDTVLTLQNILRTLAIYIWGMLAVTLIFLFALFFVIFSKALNETIS